VAHILHIAKFYPPVPGGMERVVETYATGFVERGHRVTVLSLAADGRSTHEQPRSGLHIYRERAEIKAASGHLSWGYLRRLAEIAPECDLIHMHEPNPVGTLGLLLLAKSTPLHITWHADIHRQRLALPLVKPLQAALCRRARSIQASSESLRRSSYMVSRFPDRSVVVPLGLDLARFEHAARDGAAVASVRARYGGRFLLCVGRLASYKGFHLLLDAIAGTDVTAVIVGDGPLHADLAAQARRLGLENRVFFERTVSDAEIAFLYAACDMFVLPSHTNAEAFGLVQVEAMAAGKPVVNTALETGVPEVSLDGVTGLTVRPDDAAALRDGILRLWNDPALAGRLGEAARLRAFEYDKCRVIDRLAAIYGL
jgi:rhamnosyl/mannosyltransferase